MNEVGHTLFLFKKNGIGEIPEKGFKRGVPENAAGFARVKSMGAFQSAVNCDIMPCKARGFVVQTRRFRLGIYF